MLGSGYSDGVIGHRMQLGIVHPNLS
ncbi:hypothetical protein EMIT0373P_20005 [Pseudomonas chlororaphis]